MRASMLTAVLLPGILLAAPTGRCDQPPSGEIQAETPAAEKTQAESPAVAVAIVEQDPAAEAPATSKAESSEAIRLPPGFMPKKRGKFTVYCRRADPVLGSRLQAERCYDEKGIRAYLREMEEHQENVDQMRRICGSMESCGGGG